MTASFFLGVDMKKVLFFTRDFSAENIQFAKDNGLLMRDLRAYGNDDFMEVCDAVCGDVPEVYAEKYEVVDLQPETKKAKPTADQMKKEMKAAGHEFNSRLAGEKLAEVYRDFKGAE